MSKDEFKKGDKVEWKTHGTTTQGEVEKKITSETEAAGRTVKASKDAQQQELGDRCVRGQSDRRFRAQRRGRTTHGES
ncbi:DUF2945 domain-containing protein [Antrihabitans spumae]|uniref:DUF2945 domain-containing protein n=1 Tax=Antrihabitans spumae TaxID=3373370 RepID=A0ABW7K3P1_9NOCA